MQELVKNSDFGPSLEKIEYLSQTERYHNCFYRLKMSVFFDPFRKENLKLLSVLVYLHYYDL